MVPSSALESDNCKCNSTPTHSPGVVGLAVSLCEEDLGGVFVLGVDGDDGVAVDVEERRRIPERRQVQTAAGPASKRKSEGGSVQ